MPTIDALLYGAHGAASTWHGPVFRRSQRDHLVRSILGSRPIRSGRGSELLM
ncbi:MAG: hypothetical protein ACTHV2_07360 [Brachybacterium sp.]|uniref:hypothetical protein n=1 Tax=Brachybacterium sp. TaxID=1891286 RepID=UPI0026553BF1|nr:hypothetical protein [Brachybacterium sp.]